MRSRPCLGIAGAVVLLLCAWGGSAPPVFANDLVLEHDSPAAIVDLSATFLEEARANGIDRITVSTTDAQGAEAAVGAGQFFMTVVPIERFAELSRASDLYSVPFLMADADDRAAIMRRESQVRSSFDTVTVEFGVRILAMIPVGYEGIALNEAGEVAPAAFASRRVLTNGPAERGMIGAVEGLPVGRGRHVAAIVAPWEIQPPTDGMSDANSYRAYFDLRHAPTVFVLVVNERDWAAMSEEEAARWNAAADAVESQALDMLDLRHDHELARLRAGGMEILPADENQRMEWSAMTAGLSRAIYLGEGAQLARAFLRAVDHSLSSD
ncbi:MAG: hypothetical protein RIM33_04185 [Alphaproteobacteria bacterium]